ncbi:MAG TPA: hypothetical protein VFC56_14150 [Stellaceae bacterium]|nr:hypothetical protein [Stellaceae bacterium]
MDANRLHHIFGDPRHNLGALERQYGGAEAAAEALEAMVKAAYENGVLSAHEGERYRQVFDVAGHSVTVDGRIVNGVARVSTAWVPAKWS